jgi:hypothetical protein
VRPAGRAIRAASGSKPSSPGIITSKTASRNRAFHQLAGRRAAGRLSRKPARARYSLGLADAVVVVDNQRVARTGG